MHPVHGTYRAHLGVDYGAPTGTEVVSVASGVVVSAGWAGGGGRQVRIRHAGGYETYYLHLSRFAGGIRAGTRVAQGQVIGFVGASGTATGPHLDYRVKRNGAFVNPIVEHSRMPPGDPLNGVQLAQYRESIGAVRERMVTALADSSRPDAIRANQ